MQRATWAGKPLVELPTYRWVPTVALLWPEDAAAEFLHWADNVRGVPPNFSADDSVVSLWLKTSWRGVYATAPSLVEHPDTGPSIVRTKWAGGRGRRTAVELLSGPIEDWVASVERMG